MDDTTIIILTLEFRVHTFTNIVTRHADGLAGKLPKSFIILSESPNMQLQLMYPTMGVRRNRQSNQSGTKHIVYT